MRQSINSHTDFSGICANESLYTKMWAKCMNTGFVGSLRVVASVYAVTAEFN